MKLNKKLLIFALSIVMIVGMLALAAFAAEGDAGVLTIEYPDGTVQTYAVDEEIVPPAVPKDYVVVAEDGKAYKYTVTGTTWEGVPSKATEDLLGKTVKATVAGTLGDKQVYYVTEEQLSENAPFTKVYHMNNNVHQYLSSSNTGDKGDGTNTGAAAFAALGSKETSMIRIKLYADVEVSKFTMNLMQSTRQYKSIPVYFDLNGHTVKTTQTDFVDAKSVGVRIYSSVPGAHWYQTASAQMFRTNDDAMFYLGSASSASDYGDKGNISFHGKSVFGQMYGGGAYIYGGKFYQTGSVSDAGFVEVSRRIIGISNAEFYTLAGNSPLSDTMGHDKNSNPLVADGTGKVVNCKFYCANNTDLVYATKAAKIVLENCTFANIILKAEQGSGQIVLGAGCVADVAYGSVYGSGDTATVLARTDAKAYNGFVGADGNVIPVTLAYETATPASALKITTNTGTEYWTVGATFPVSAGDFVQLSGNKLLTNPVYNIDGVAEIVDGKVVAAGEISVSIKFLSEDIAAFTYLDTKTGKLYGVGYETDCGGTAAGVGDKFHELFNDPASAYVITMYTDMTLSKAVPFGALVMTSDATHNRDYFNSLANGSIVWDLNGTTVTIASNVTGLVRMAAANCSLTSGSGATYNGNTVFGFEGTSVANSFTLKSSVPGGKIVNESSGHLFGVGEGKKTKMIFEGENLTIISPKGLIINSGELERSLADLKNGEDVRHVINGGVYISGSDSGVFIISMSASLKDATIISTSANAARVVNQDTYRIGNVTVENCIFVAANSAAIAYKAGASNAHKLTFKDCVYVNCVPTNLTSCPSIVALTHEGINLADTEANLALIYASAPAGTAKYTFKVAVVGADGTKVAKDLIGYAPADQVLAVTYSGANVTEYYLVGKEFIPVAMDPSYYTVEFDLVNGTVNIPVVWAGLPTGGVVTAGGVLNAVPADNLIPLAFVLAEGEDIVAYTLADSTAIGADLATALAAQKAAGVLYVYVDITAPALSVVKPLEVDLTGKKLTLGGTLTVNADLSVKAGEILSAEAKPFALSANLLLDGTKVYLSSATVVFDGTAGVATLKNVNIFNLAAPAPVAADAVTVALNGAKLMNVKLGANVTVAGTVLGTAGTFAGAAYADGVIADLIVNNNKETVNVLGETYTIVYAEGATDDADKAIVLTYVYKDEIRGTQKYYFGSIASFYKEFTDGYYFAYEGENTLAEDATIECAFHADASKLKAQIILTDALNFTFYLQVEEEGVLANLMLNEEALDLSVLRQVRIDGVAFYVIPVAFESFADSLDDYVLSVDLVSGADVLTISATAALDEYLSALLATAAEDDAKKAYAIANYVSALINYFDYDFAFGDVRMKNLGRLNNLLADYAKYKVEAELPAETVVSSAYFKSVVLVADEVVTFAFRVENDFAGKVKIGASEVALTKPFEGFDRTFATTSVHLCDLSEQITLTVVDAEGAELETMTYSLADYVAGVIAQNEGTVGEYAKALWNLATVLG